LKLSTIFAIDIAAYAVMTNHYHVVLHINQHKATHWSERDVIEHWHKLFKGNLFSQKYLSGEPLHKAERIVLDQVIEEWRSRLSSISWFMRCANEPIAREANKEDNVSGRFWEGRFKSQALLDEKALTACMAYVDLNPIRAKMAITPQQSEHTSVQRRIKQALHHRQPKDLYPFAGNPRKDMSEGIPFQLTDYLELVDWTGRILREDKRGAIPDYRPTILQRLNIDTRNWIYLSTSFESPFKNLVGGANNVRAACNELGKQWTHGIRQCEEIFSSG
jgi:hypothetical protein